MSDHEDIQDYLADVVFLVVKLIINQHMYPR